MALTLGSFYCHETRKYSVGDPRSGKDNDLRRVDVRRYIIQKNRRIYLDADNIPIHVPVKRKKPSPSPTIASGGGGAEEKKTTNRKKKKATVEVVAAVPVDLDKETVFDVTIQMHVPLKLQPLTWQRHQLTLQDIQTVAESFPAHALWPVIMIYGKPIDYPSVRTSADNRILWTGKQNASNSIREIAQEFFAAAKGKGREAKQDDDGDEESNSMLCHAADETKSLLPAHNIDADQWALYKKWLIPSVSTLGLPSPSASTLGLGLPSPSVGLGLGLPSPSVGLGLGLRLPPPSSSSSSSSSPSSALSSAAALVDWWKEEVSGSPPRHSPHLIVWRNILLVPLDVHRKHAQLLHMGRVVSIADYVACYGEPHCSAEIPRIVKIQHMDMDFVQVEEDCYFYIG